MIRRLLDNGDFLEVHALFARNLIVGFARIEGVVVGIVANNSLEKAGALDMTRPTRRALHPFLQQLQHPRGDPGGRAGFSARH